MTRIDELSAELSAPKATAAPESGIAAVSQAEAQSKSIREAAQTKLKETLSKLNALPPPPTPAPGQDSARDPGSAQTTSALRTPARVATKAPAPADASPTVAADPPSSSQQNVQAA